MRTLFWILIAADVSVLALFLLLGLAAAPSSRTSPISVAAFMLPIPILFIVAAILLFTRTTATGWRGLAIACAAAPWLIVFYLRASEDLKFRLNSDSQGNMTYFRPGPLRDLAAAISRNDAATVADIAPRVDINARGYSGMTPLMLTFRQLRETPQQLDCLRAIMRAKPAPDIGSNYETPLEIALQISRRTGSEPVRLLLEAGASPNRKNSFGSPAYFQAIAVITDPEILRLLFDHGADLQAKDRNGLSVVFQAAQTQNWRAALLLLKRGVPWKNMRGANGLTLLDTAESDARVYGDEDGLPEVIAYLRAH